MLFPVFSNIEGKKGTTVPTNVSGIVALFQKQKKAGEKTLSLGQHILFFTALEGRKLG